MNENSGESLGYIKKPLTIRLAGASLGLWVISLLLPGIITGGMGESLPGYEILITGWLSPVVFNFAWYANPVYLLTGIGLFLGKTAPRSSLLSVVLGFDMFRLSELASSVGNYEIYGLGWGAIVWLAALLLMMAAAGMRQIEVRPIIWWEDRGYEWLKTAAFISLFLMLGITTYLAIDTRLHSSDIPFWLSFEH